ncbi:ABC transporter permease [Bacillus sp. FJAT-49736]|uniref:ABC transporter permease n=1 Tax=Bacillus sp. FJAT-49736 TaxID=2833582 RepID=UPI001BC8E89C|nr:ABC transporter permease [Bacillus sp. FJAT-49736]MBS4175087.1 ABC transporter permease [Bacillus sp. FJAT-49736]
MGKFMTVFTFHLKEALTSKSFVIGNLITLIIIVGVFGFNHLSSKESKDKVALINTTSYETDINLLNNGLKSVKLYPEEKNNLGKLKQQVKQGDLDGIIEITEKNGLPALTYQYKSFADQELVAILSQKIQQVGIDKTIKDSRVDPNVAAKLLAPISVENIALKDTSGTSGIVYIFVFLMYILILGRGQMIANTITAEKSSRVMEIMIPKVKPIFMMYGKILVQLVIGLADIVVMILGFLVSYALGWFNGQQFSLFGFHIDLSNLTPFIIICFIIYFTLGFLLYAIGYAAVGAVVSRTEDLSSVSFPIILCIMAAFFIGINSIFAPASTLVTVCSYIPVTSPIVTFSRILAGEAGYLEMGITIVILLASITILNHLANRIYLNGVMNYSGKVKFKDVVQMAKKH